MQGTSGNGQTQLEADLVNVRLEGRCLADSSCPRDEYDAYLLQAVGRLRQGQTIDQVAGYLEKTASNDMGLGPSTPASRAASERTATLIHEYLAHFPPGPLKVR